MIDPDRRQYLDSLCVVARMEGVDLWELVDRHGLILTKDREAKIRKEVLDKLIEHFKGMEPYEVLRAASFRSPCTAADMYQAMIRYIQLGLVPGV